MHITPEISGCSVVLLGQFNPAIFHPAWLYGKGIEEETSEDNGEVLTHRQIAQFSIDTRSYIIRPERFQLETVTAPWVKILDITTKIFGEFLYHTPISAVGINRIAHFKLPSLSSRTKLGRLLAPIEPWGDFGQRMEPSNDSSVGGLKSLTMRQMSTLGGHAWETSVTIEPSVRIAANTGVYMQINAHHLLSDATQAHGSEEAMALLGSRFDGAVNDADKIIDTIMRRS